MKFLETRGRREPRVPDGLALPIPFSRNAEL